jgi:hypothetical protein
VLRRCRGGQLRLHRRLRATGVCGLRDGLLLDDVRN